MMSEHQHPDPMPPGGAEALYTGRRRPKFHRDAPGWFTLLVFGTFIALILIGILFAS
jgi:hypothetical protein